MEKKGNGTDRFSRSWQMTAAKDGGTSQDKNGFEVGKAGSIGRRGTPLCHEGES